LIFHCNSGDQMEDKESISSSELSLAELNARKAIAKAMEVDQLGQLQQAKKDYLKAGQFLQSVISRITKDSELKIKLMHMFVMVMERCECIDIEIEKELPKEAKRKRNIVNELVVTERSYVRSLSIVEEVFMKPLIAQKTLPAESISLVFF